MPFELQALLTLLSLFISGAAGQQSCQDYVPAGYTIEGSNYQMYCGQEYSNHSQYLQITYQDTLTNCIDFCRRWDEPGSPCQGVMFNTAESGAPGIEGQLCYLLWNTTGVSTIPNSDIDVALLRNATVPSGNCSAANNTYTSATGLVFNQFCNADLDVAEGDIHLSYTYDLYSCMEACSDWNRNSSVVQCRALTFDYGYWAPGEPGGRSQCWLKQEGTGSGTPRAGLPIHSMTLQSQFWVNNTANSICLAPGTGDGISGGVKGGIAAAVIGGLLVGAFGMFLFMHHKRPPAARDEGIILI